MSKFPSTYLFIYLFTMQQQSFTGKQKERKYSPQGRGELGSGEVV
jgi:hypothetical protein